MLVTIISLCLLAVSDHPAGDVPGPARPCHSLCRTRDKYCIQGYIMQIGYIMNRGVHYVSRHTSHVKYFCLHTHTISNFFLYAEDVCWQDVVDGWCLFKFTVLWGNLFDYGEVVGLPR